MKRIVSFFIVLFCVLNLQAQFITRQGTDLVLDHEPIMLQGMSFGNFVWVDREVPSMHHNEDDYRRLEDLGMNAIRFYLNYKTFEDDTLPYTYKQAGWDWIDLNIAWAKKHGIYLILNMHVPQGGFQSQCKGEALWDVPENQKRLAALWKEIADHYKDEPTIAAFDILNEPTPKDSVQQWFGLANRIIDSIRTVDDHHLLITERALAVGCDYGYNDGNYNYPPVTEQNLMYTVHMYEPYTYTHQMFDWTGLGDGGKYPDLSIVTFPLDLEYATGNYSNPSPKSGSTDWTYYEGSIYEVKADSIIAGRLILQGQKLGVGKIFFDDLVINEVDKNGEVVEQIFKINFSVNESPWFWSEKNDGKLEVSTDGHGDNFSYSITGTSGYSSAGINKYTFPVQKGKRYVVSGWMKGVNVPTGATGYITSEYYYSPSGSANTTRDKAFLESTILSYTQYIEDKGYPVYFGEFGAGRPCFENNKGGDVWARDVMDIFREKGYHFTYHAYKESSFGYYENWEGLPDTTTVNVALQKVFEEFFGKKNPLQVLDEGEQYQLSIYPNPTNGVLNGLEGFASFEIVDLQGQTIIRIDRTSAKLDLSSLQNGMYYLKVYDTADKQLFQKTFVKQ